MGIPRTSHLIAVAATIAFAVTLAAIGLVNADSSEDVERASYLASIVFAFVSLVWLILAGGTRKQEAARTASHWQSVAREISGVFERREAEGEAHTEEAIEFASSALGHAEYDYERLLRAEAFDEAAAVYEAIGELRKIVPLGRRDFRPGKG